MRISPNRLLLIFAALILVVVVAVSPIMAQVGNGTLFLPFAVHDEGVSEAQDDADVEPSPTEEAIVKLPLYTPEELEELRGIPLDPEDPNTLYLPPGVEQLTDLPRCVYQNADDPETEIDEEQLEHDRRVADGTDDRNRQLRVLICAFIPEPTTGMSMTVEEYERWWQENGRPTMSDPATDHPDGPLYNQPQTPTYSWVQHDLLSPSSPDLTFSALYADYLIENSN